MLCKFLVQTLQYLKKKKNAQKVAHNWLGLSVFSSASFCFVQLRHFYSLFFFFIFEVVKLCRMMKAQWHSTTIQCSAVQCSITYLYSESSSVKYPTA